MECAHSVKSYDYFGQWTINITDLSCMLVLSTPCIIKRFPLKKRIKKKLMCCPYAWLYSHTMIGTCYYSLWSSFPCLHGRDCMVMVTGSLSSGSHDMQEGRYRKSREKGDRCNKEMHTWGIIPCFTRFPKHNGYHYMHVTFDPATLGFTCAQGHTINHCDALTREPRNKRKKSHHYHTTLHSFHSK